MERLNSLAEYEALVGHSKDLLVVVDEEGQFRYLSPSTPSVLGYERETLLGASGFDYVHPDDLPVVEQLFRRTVEGDPTHTERSEFRVRHADGSWRWLEAVVSEATESPLAGYVIDARDVTDRRRTEAQLQYFLSNSSDLVHIFDEEGVLVESSPNAGEALGYDGDELLGQSLLEYVHPEDRERTVDEFERALDDPGQTSTVEFRFRTADGEWRWFESRGQSLPPDSPLRGRLVVISRDVTERKQREQQLERQNERLEEFAGIVSHDIRNPLSVARGNLDLFRQTGDESHLDDVERAHDRIGELVTDVLSLARTGLVVDDLSPVDLDDCFAEALRMTPVDANQVVVDSRLPTVMGDAERLYTLFENLLRNAVEHGSTGPRSEARADAVEHGSPGAREGAAGESSTAGDGRVDGGETGSDGIAGVTIYVGSLPDGFYVADDGPGIAPDDHERVFDPGFSSTDDGTGYGLAIVDTIARAHGWSVLVTEGEEGGARFEFTDVAFAESA